MSDFHVSWKNAQLRCCLALNTFRTREWRTSEFRKTFPRAFTRLFRITRAKESGASSALPPTTPLPTMLDKCTRYFSRVSTLGTLRKARRQRQRERHETKGLMSRTIAVHVHYNSWYISLPSSAKQKREMTKFCVVWRT